MSYDGSGIKDNASLPLLSPIDSVYPTATMPPGSDAVLSAAASFSAIPLGLPPFNLVYPTATMPPGSDAVLSAAASFSHDKEVTDAVTDALGVLRERHKAVFLARAFGIDANGNPVVNSDVPTKKDRSAKSIHVHKEMIQVLSNWGNDDEMKTGTLSEEQVEDIRRWHKNNPIGYTWCSEFTVESLKKVDGSPRYLLIKHRTRKGKPMRGQVLNYLEVFDAIDEVHRSLGHLRQEATLVARKPKYYSVTQYLVKIYCECCSTCMKKNPTIPPCKGAKKPILSCAFRDRFQIDLIDMRKMQRKDIYGVVQRWIMTIKDHSTGHVLRCSSKQKSRLCSS
jgi:hypothetical protein